MIDYIIYGEFDINEGSVIKVEYPNKTGINEMTLASYLMPEGTHNLLIDCFSFIINRNASPDEIFHNKIKTQLDKLNLNLIKYLDLKSSPNFTNLEGKCFKLKEIYNYNSYSVKWESLNISQNLSKTNKEENTNIHLKLCQDINENYFNIIILDTRTSEVFFNIPIHTDIQFKKLSNTFASIYTLNSQAIGFDFDQEQDLSILEKLFENENVETMTNKNDDLASINIFTDFDSFMNSEKETYYLCYLETKLDKNTKRGAILKSVAIGSSSLINLKILKPIAKFLLDEIFKIHFFNIKEEEKLNLIKKSIELCYQSVNKLPSKFFGVGIPFYEREINCYLQSSNYFVISDEKYKEVEIGNQKIRLEMLIPNYEEKIFPGNLTEFVKLFKENTMTIYDGILSDKKILFIGDSNTSCEKLSTFIFSTVSMVTPACMSIIKRIHPYKNLYDLEFLKYPNFIFGATNPIFKNKTDSWDIMCEIDTGKVTINESYKKYLSSINRDSDNFFIKELLYKIKNEFINELEVEKYFKMYTNHLMKITGEQYFSDDDELSNEINKQYKRKLKIQMSSFWNFDCQYNKIREFIGCNGRNLNLIQVHINNLFSRKNIEKKECLLIYTDIDKFLSGGEFYVNLVSLFNYLFLFYLISC